MKAFCITIVRLPKWHIQIWTVHDTAMMGPDDRVLDYFRFYENGMPVYDLCMGAFTEQRFHALRVRAINNDGDGFEIER